MMFSYSELAVVGFNGTARGDCGYAVAIARHNPTGKYIRLSFPDAELELAKGLRPAGEDVPIAPETYAPKGHVSVNDESAIKSLRDEEALTLFRGGVEFRAFHNAMVLHVAQPLLDSAGVRLQQSTRVEELDWRLLSEVPHKVWVTCATVDSVFLLMDGWGEALRDECIDHLIGYIASGEKDKNLLVKAEHSAELALGAARDDVLREDLFLLYGVTVTFSAPQRVDDIFELDFLPEFKEKQWPWFEQQLKRLVDTLRIRAIARSAISVGMTKEIEASDPEARPLVKRILMRHPPAPPLEALMQRVAADARKVRSEASLRERIAKAVEVAESCRSLFDPDDNEAKKIADELRRPEFNPIIKIETEARLRVFAADPFFYLLPDDVRMNAKGEVNFFEYGAWAGDHGSECREMNSQTPHASFILQQVEEMSEEAAVGVGR